MRHDAPCLRTDDPPSRPAGRLGVTTWVVRREREGYTRLVTATDYNTGTRRHTPDNTRDTRMCFKRGRFVSVAKS